MPMTQEQIDEMRASVRTAVGDHLSAGRADEIFREELQKFLAKQDKDFARSKSKSVKEIRESLDLELGIVGTRAIRAQFLATRNGGGAEGAMEILDAWRKKDQKFGGELDQSIIDLYEKVDKALLSSELEAGAALVPPVFYDEIIELLRTKTSVRMMGARSIPITGGTLTMPRQTGAASASYIGEEENIPVSQIETGQLRFVLRKLAALTVQSNDLIRDGSNMVDAIIRDDLSQVMMIREDLQFLRGSGGEHAPQGLRYLTDPTHIVAATSTLSLVGVKDDLTGLIQRVMEAEIPMIRPGWIINPRTEKFLKNMGDDRGWWYADEMRMNRTIEGYPYACTTQIPTTLSTDGDETEIYFGDFAQVLIGEGMGITIDANPNGAYHDGSQVRAGFSEDTSQIRAIARHDIKLKYKKAFAVLTGVDWNNQPT